MNSIGIDLGSRHINGAMVRNDATVAIVHQIKGTLLLLVLNNVKLMFILIQTLQLGLQMMAFCTWGTIYSMNSQIMNQ